eukprot:Clim_evm16s156 gene=Clim_evmTU16s156
MFKKRKRAGTGGRSLVLDHEEDPAAAVDVTKEKSEVKKGINAVDGAVKKAKLEVETGCTTSSPAKAELSEKQNSVDSAEEGSDENGKVVNEDDHMKEILAEERKRIKDTGQITNEYRGQRAYVTFGSEGPKTAKRSAQQENSTLRRMEFVDQQKIICKDFKETGFCGFGDTCQFLHDRTDLSKGMSIDRNWDVTSRTRAKTISGEMDVAPSVCPLCRRSFLRPVVTACQHYFCEGCIIKRATESSRNAVCPVCKKSLNLVFNDASKVIKAEHQRDKP